MSTSTLPKTKLKVQEFNQMEMQPKTSSVFTLTLFHNTVPLVFYLPVPWGLERQVYATRVKRSLLTEA